jgi:dsRNA-specific ribonuclease
VTAADRKVDEEMLMPAKKMSAEHKAALAKGRNQANAVRAYLGALEANRPKRGRKRTSESIERRLAAIDAEYEIAGSLTALQLLQERKNLEAEVVTLRSASGGEDLERLRKEFVRNAKAYAQAKGIAYGTWREIGVSAEVLRQAGISRAG